MKTFIRTAKASTAGEALPMPFTNLSDLGARIHRREVSMIAGAPGAGKSTLALALAAKTGVRTLYLCADTSEHTMRLRLGAMLTGLPQTSVEKRMVDLDWQRGIFEEASHIVWTFDGSPTIESITDDLRAYTELWGSPPELLVVDNLIDISDGGDNEWTALRSTMKALKTLAHQSTAAVLVLHHTSEAAQFTVAPPRAAIQGKVAQLPALIMTVNSVPETETLTVAVVKNRHGQAQANGSYASNLRFVGATMTLEDQRTRV